MSKTTIVRRLGYEASEMKNSPPDNCSAGPKNDDLMNWEATIIGPKGSPFEGGIFNLTIKFPQNYPFRAPEVKFVTPVYHPNINKHGDICLDILKDQWSPALSISKVLLSICSLLTDPNPNDPLEPDVARMYKDNKLEYEITARQYTEKYAVEGAQPVKEFANNNYHCDDNDDDNDDDDDSDDSDY